jgi:hypothetical protein
MPVSSSSISTPRLRADELLASSRADRPEAQVTL